MNPIIKADVLTSLLLSHLNHYVRKSQNSLALFLTATLLIFTSPIAKAQGYVLGNYGSSYSTGNGMGGSMGMGAGAGGGSFTLGYPGVSQAQIDQSLLNGNKEMLRNDVDYEDYLLRKRTAFAQQMQQSDQTENKLRAYAEQRLKALTQSGSKLTTAQQAESHDLMDWLKKDAEQRANNLSWLKRQDQAIASLEQDQMLSMQNQRNALHNIYEDNLAVQSQYKWNQQMQLANLHLTQNRQGAVSWGRPPQDGLANITGGYGGGFGGGGFGRRWGY